MFKESARGHRRLVVCVALAALSLGTSILALPGTKVDHWLRSRLMPGSITNVSLEKRSYPGASSLRRSVQPHFVLAPPLSAPTGLGVPTAASTAITLSWTAPSGSVDHYLVERSQSLSGPFTVIATAASASFNDTTVTGVNSYLYRVRAVNGFGAPSPPSNMALGTAITFLDPTLSAGVTEIKAQHITDLRQAINAVRALASLNAATWTQQDLNQALVYANDVQELRNKLDEALTALSIHVTAYQDSTLATGTDGTLIKKVHIEQLRERATRGTSNSSGPLDSTDVTSARLDPMNRTGGGGEDPLSRNFNWGLPLVSLPGRGGLDLGLSLSYNSLATWTKHGSVISFDDDYGFPAPGFRLGFPVIEPIYYNTHANKYSFLMITSSGARVELRQVGTSTFYQAVDSSYLLLDASSSTMILRTTDGTRLSYVWQGDDYKCTEVKDRNGNVISINYDNSTNRLTSVIDTLNRTITFNYEGNDLASITQSWYGQTHYWARFAYTNKTIQTNFSNLTVYGPANNTTIRALTQVKLADDSHFDFDYTSWGQVWKFSQYTNETTPHLVNYRSYNLPADNSSAQDDCPRFTQRHDWAENWNLDSNGTAQEVTTSFAAPSSATIPGTSQTGLFAQVTQPDGTSQKLYYGSASGSPAWQHGLIRRVETYESGNSTAQRSVTTDWTQDDTNVSYQLNPRVTETNIYDPAGNHARTRVAYTSSTLSDGTTIYLPEDKYEYQADASTQLRRTHVTYNLASAYTSLRIIGLVSESKLYAGPSNSETLMAKVSYLYDQSGSIQGTDAPVQHDNPNYSSSFVTGRANVSSVTRHDVVTTSQSTTSTIKYNTAGAVVETTDPLSHSVTLSYTDHFSANGTDLDSSLGFSTLAYPTTVTDADGFTSTMRYNYAFGGGTRKQTPKPNETTTTSGNQNGPVQITEYDSIGRLQKIRNTVNSAYTRYAYHPTYVETFATVNTVNDEAHSLQYFDGAGRVIGKAGNHPGSTGGYSGQRIYYDTMGRVVKQSNPTETSASGTNPYSWTATGDDATAGWLYTQQTYDWKGRPLVTTNTDDTTKTASYGGCGCAGGEVVTLTDEGTIDGGTAKRRQQKVYSDVLGRTVKTEILNWEGGSVYSTTVSQYNARDQVTLLRQYQGTDQSSTYQDTTMSYDGYGRLHTKHVPEQRDQSGNPTYTTYAYNTDDTVHSVTDARGASATYAYNNRRLVTAIDYSTPTGMTPTSNVTFEYDAVGNRTLMNDGLGSVSYVYNQLSRMTSETRTLTGLDDYEIGYDYNLAGQLKSVTDPAGAVINYGFDNTGRIDTVTGTSFGGVTTYASGAQYRSFGALKYLDYGNTRTMEAGYNTRMQSTSFTVSGVMSKTYEYYADGNIRFSSDLLNHKFDRSYGFDHAARMAQAFTGAEARGESATNDRPYKQIFSYDGFSHLTNRDSNVWADFYSTADSYTNDRRTDWDYDASGNLLESADATYTYDTAGSISTVATIDPQSTTTRILDGDGRQIKSVTATYDETSQSWNTTTTYYVRSTVLGGQVLTELNENGTKHRTFVYAGGQVLATQEILGVSTYEQVTWEHRDPSNASYRTTQVNGDLSEYAELDPTGSDAGIHAPLIPFQDVDEGAGSFLPYPSFGNPSRLGTSYHQDGIPVTADYFKFEFDRITRGSTLALVERAARESRRVIGTRVITEGWKATHHNGGYDDDIGNGIVRVGSTDEYYFDVITTLPIYSESWANILFLNAVQQPQNFDPDREGIRANLAKALSVTDCANFIKNLLARVASNANPLVEGGDLLKIFDRVLIDREGKRGGGEATGSFSEGNPRVGFTTTIFGGKRTPEGMRGTYLHRDSLVALHELIHLAGWKGYDDEALANAASGLPDAAKLKQLPFPTGGSPEAIQSWVLHYSNYWDTELRNHCKRSDDHSPL